MSLEPLATVHELAALVGIRPGHPDDRADLAVLTEMLHRREQAARARPARLAVELEPGADRVATWWRLLGPDEPSGADDTGGS